MTRKDYVLIAAAVREERERFSNRNPGADDLVRALADSLAADNPRFDRARFLKACGVEG